MAISVFKTFSAGEVLTAADLNASLTQIVNNGTDVAFPTTKAVSMGGFALGFDGSSAVTLTSSGVTNGLNLAGGAFNTPQSSNIDSAGTLNLETATGNVVDVDGTATITAITLSQGHWRIVRFSSGLTLTHGASLLLPGAASINVVAGDYAIFVGYGSGIVRCIHYQSFTTSPVASVPASICEFRLCLTSGTPINTADSLLSTSIYATPFKGNRIALYDGSRWNIRTSAEFFLALGTLTSGLPYDVFCYDSSGAPTLEFLAWTNATTRATALTTQNGVYVKSGAVTRRYLGTFVTVSTTQTQDSLDKRFLWNYYNRVARPMRVREATASWNYTTATVRQANAAAANELDFVIGVVEDSVTATVAAAASNSSANVNVGVGIGYDVTNAFTVGCLGAMSVSLATADQVRSLQTTYRAYPTVGKHFLAWVETSAATGTTTWWGDYGTPGGPKSGIYGEIFG